MVVEAITTSLLAGAVLSVGYLLVTGGNIKAAREALGAYLPN